eukprot:5541226-Pleurochrysis_carterae.AAC.3
MTEPIRVAECGRVLAPALGERVRNGRAQAQHVHCDGGVGEEEEERVSQRERSHVGGRVLRNGAQEAEHGVARVVKRRARKRVTEQASPGSVCELDTEYAGNDNWEKTAQKGQKVKWCVGSKDTEDAESVA